MNRSLSGVFFKSIAISATHITPVCLFLIAYFKNIGLELSTIAALMTTKKVARILFDIPFGILFDKFGAKCVFFTSKTLKILSFVLLLVSDNPTVLFVSMILNGTAYSSFYGKFNAYVFNILKENNQLKYFHKTISMFYLVGDLQVLFFGALAIKIQHLFGYKVITYISIIILLIGLLVVSYLPNDMIQEHKNKNINQIVKDMIQFFRLHPNFIYLPLFIGVGNFFGSNAGIMTSILMIDIGYSAQDTALYGVIAKSLTGAAAILNFIFPINLSIKSSINGMILAIFGIFIANFFYHKMFINILILYCFLYLFFQISIEKFFENHLEKGSRGTITSTGFLISTFISIISSSVFIPNVCRYHFKEISIAFIGLILFILCYGRYKVSKLMYSNNLA